MLTFKLFFALLLPVITCEDRLQWHPLIPEYAELMFVFGIVLAGGIIRQIVILYNISITCAVFIITGGFLWGILAYHSDILILATSVIHWNPLGLVHAYLPILIFSATFNIDTTVFIKTLPQLMIIGGPVAVLTACAFGVMMQMGTDAKCTVEHTVLLGMFSCPIYPFTIIHLLQNNAAQTKQIAVLLQGEAVFGICITSIGYSLMIGHTTGFVVYWYQHVALVFRFVAIGLLAGYVLGIMGRYFLRKTYTNKVTVFLVTFVYPFFVHAFSEKYMSGCGCISVGVVGLMVSRDQTSLAKDVNSFILSMWYGVSYGVEFFLGAITAVITILKCAGSLTATDYVLSVMFYFMYYATRFVCFILFSPATSRLGYGIDLKDTIVCVFSGIKCPLSPLLVRVFMFLKTREKENVYCFYIMVLYYLSNLINGSVTKIIMNFLGLRVISMARQLNMNHCLKHIFTTRERTIAVLKMNRFLTDANWSMVIEATNIDHPYHTEMLLEDEDADFWESQYQSCPECQNEIRQEPTAKEWKEMTREARMRVLKAKKMYYSRQFENGMVSTEGIRILSQAVEMAMDSEEAVIEMHGLEKRFAQESLVTRCVRNRVQELNRSKSTAFRPPRKYVRRIFYDIVLKEYWEKAMLVVVFLTICIMVIDTGYHGWLLVNKHEVKIDYPIRYVLNASGILFTIIFVLEFFMKVSAYSWLYYWKHGVRTYFRSILNIINFIAIIAFCVAVPYDLVHIARNQPQTEKPLRQIVNVVQWLIIFRFVRLFDMFYSRVILYLDRHVDVQLATTFELGKNYGSGEVEILEMLPYMIDNDKIQEKIRVQVESDKQLVFQLLGKVQKEKPRVAITVKTKQAIRTILKSMNDTINQLKISGWVDDFELEKLKLCMVQLYKRVNSIKTVSPSAPKMVFKEVAWMGKDEAVINLLFGNVTVKAFEPGDVVLEAGTCADGIGILVSGLFTITYTPDEKILMNLKQYGQLPVIDYFLGTKFEEPFLEHVFSGNCFGELSTVTGGTYDCVVKAESHSQVYFLSKAVLKRAMEMDPDPVSGLECRIWREIGIRIGVSLLLSVAAYQNYSQDQVKYTLERAFVPNLSNFKNFVVTDMIQDILLIEGVAADFNNRHTFIAPCYIPRTVQKLIINIPLQVETKLLLILEKDANDYNLVTNFDGDGELAVVATSSRCLQHTAQQRLKKQKRIRLKDRKTSLDDEETRKETETGTLYYRTSLKETSSAVQQV